MKKSTLITLWIAVSLMFFGGVLAVCTFAISGGNIGIRHNNGSFIVGRWDNRSLSSGAMLTENVEFTDISSLDINTDIGEVKIAPGDTNGKFLVSYGYNPSRTTVSCTAEGGILNFTSRYSFVIGIDHPTDLHYITITYPRGTAFSTINLLTTLGELHLTDTTADSINIKTDLGQIVCSGITSKSFISSSSLGETSITNSTLGNAEINSDLGQIVARDITTSSLDLSCSAGDAKLTGELKGTTSIQCDLGAVSVTTNLPRTAYNLDLQADLGGIKLDGKRERNTISENNNAANTIEIKSSASSISLNFK